MKRTTLALLLALTAGMLQAQEGTNWVDVQGAYINQDGNWRGMHIKDSGGIGAGFGRWFTNRWGFEASVLNTKLKSRHERGDETHGFVSGLFNLNPGDHTFYPYLRAGLGASHVDHPWSRGDHATTRLNYHAGFGVQGFFKEHLFTSLEARVVEVATRTKRTEVMGVLGLGYRWGASKPVPPPPPPVQPPVEETKPVEPPPPPPPVQPETKPVVVTPPPPAKIVLDQAMLHFTNNKAILSEEGVAAVQKVAGELRQYSGEYNLVVAGHTSSTGSKAWNKTLSKRRADAVAKVLAESGIPAATIQTVGYGPDQPIADNKTKEGQATNRRVEIEVKVRDTNVETRTIRTQTQDAPAPKPRRKKKAPATP